MVKLKMCYNISMDYRKQLSEAYMNRDKSTIESIMEKMVNQRLIMDKWFDLFIEKFSDKMDQEKRTAPVWKKYYEKFDEYSDLQRQINTAEFYISNV